MLSQIEIVNYTNFKIKMIGAMNDLNNTKIVIQAFILGDSTMTEPKTKKPGETIKQGRLQTTNLYIFSDLLTSYLPCSGEVYDN